MYTKFHSQSPIIHGATAPSGSGPPHYRGLAITLRHTTLDRTPLDGDQPNAKASTSQHTTPRDRYQCPRWDLNPQSQHAIGPRLTP